MYMYMYLLRNVVLCFGLIGFLVFGVEHLPCITTRRRHLLAIMQTTSEKHQAQASITAHERSTGRAAASEFCASPKNGKRQSPSKIRRRCDGSPMTLSDPKQPTKTVYLIRHGQSCGQIAKQLGMDRKSDPRLLDCGLTQKGEQEATQIPRLLGQTALDSIQLVVSSPLTRALLTSIIAFPSKNIIVHFDLREVGSKVPENTPRSMNKVLRDASHLMTSRDEGLLLDVTTLQPTDWPRDYRPMVIMMERIRQSFLWLYNERDESVIAVVCHYNVIRSAVIGRADLRPSNAIPIRCTLFSNGDLVLDS
jgi:broad specificity phosphatase PhoE